MVAAFRAMSTRMVWLDRGTWGLARVSRSICSNGWEWEVGVQLGSPNIPLSAGLWGFRHPSNGPSAPSPGSLEGWDVLASLAASPSPEEGLTLGVP